MNNYTENIYFCLKFKFNLSVPILSGSTIDSKYGYSLFFWKSLYDIGDFFCEHLVEFIREVIYAWNFVRFRDKYFILRCASVN